MAAAEALLHEMHAWGLKILVYETLKYLCMRPSASIEMATQTQTQDTMTQPARHPGAQQTNDAQAWYLERARFFF
jgi:hypothetical protein